MKTKGENRNGKKIESSKRTETSGDGGEVCGSSYGVKRKGDYEALRKLPRDSSPTRLKNRCLVTGRPRGYLRSSKCPGLLLGNTLIKDKFRE